MKYARAIYQWWKSLSVWVRIPLSIVLLVAFLALVLERIKRVVWPVELNPYKPLAETRIAEQEHNAEALQKAVLKADRQYAEIKKGMSRENDKLQDTEKDIDKCDSVECVDGVIADLRERNRR